MKDLSLHILDIVQNSLVADASTIDIMVDEDYIKDKLTISIIDNVPGVNILIRYECWHRFPV